MKLAIIFSIAKSCLSCQMLRVLHLILQWFLINTSQHVLYFDLYTGFVQVVQENQCILLCFEQKHPDDNAILYQYLMI